MRIYDNSITPEEPKVPDFKVSTVYYQVENGHDRDGLGSEENYFWKTAKERKNEENWDYEEKNKSFIESKGIPSPEDIG